MTASEKLKALEAWFADEANYGEPWAEVSADLIVALPQIRAVMEAAEEMPNQCFNFEIGWTPCEELADRDEWERWACSACRQRDALATLDEALP